MSPNTQGKRGPNESENIIRATCPGLQFGTKEPDCKYGARKKKEKKKPVQVRNRKV